MTTRPRGYSRALSPPSTSLYSAPAPAQSRSRLYSHGHSERRLIAGRQASRSRSQSAEGSDAEDSASPTPSINGRGRFRGKGHFQDAAPKYREPSHRRLHLQRVFDLLRISISRRDGERAFRCLRILLKSHEWRPNELWRYALEVVTLTCTQEDQAEEIDPSPSSTHDIIARRRLAFLREVSKARTGLQLDVFIEIIPELLALGQDQQALAELEIVLNQYPYRLEPILHLYSALIFLRLSSPGTDGESSTVQYTMRGVSEADRALAFVPNNLRQLRDRGDEAARSILKEAERKFETVLNVGRMQSKRGRMDVARSRSRSRSRSKSRSRSRSRSKSRARGSIKQDYSSHSEHGEVDELDMSTDNEEAEHRITIANDEWARNMARAYLEVLRATLVAPIRVQDSDDEMQDDSF